MLTEGVFQCVHGVAGVFRLTNSKELNASISQAFSGWYDIILRLPIGDEDPDLGQPLP